MKNTFTITLTKKQINKLWNVLVEAQDEGPIPEGWQSEELEKLVEIIETAKKEVL